MISHTNFLKNKKQKNQNFYKQLDCSYCYLLQIKRISIIIMIRSSDKKFNNTYRILRVLSIHHYLAIDLDNLYYIFIQAHRSNQMDNSQILPLTYRSESQYLLRYLEIISIDQLIYYVFSIGQRSVVKAVEIENKKLKHEPFIFTLINNAINNILMKMLWMNQRQALAYLDLNNFWVLDGELYILLMHRNKNVYSLKRSQKSHSFCHQNSTISVVIDRQYNTIKQFAQIIWNIIYQSPYNQRNYSSLSHPFIKNILSLMIRKQISYQQIVNAFSKHNGGIYRKTRLNNFRTLKTSFVVKRQKTTSSQMNQSAVNKQESLYNQTPMKLSPSMRNMIKIGVKKQKKYSEQKISNHCHQINMRKDSFLFQRNKSMSVQKCSKMDQTQSNKYRKNKYYKAARDENPKLQNWISNKKYSLNVQEMIIRQNYIAQNKFKSLASGQSGQKKEKKFNQEEFRGRLIEKVQNMKQKRSLIVRLQQKDQQNTLKNQSCLSLQTKQVIDPKKLNQECVQDVKLGQQQFIDNSGLNINNQSKPNLQNINQSSLKIISDTLKNDEMEKMQLPYKRLKQLDNMNKITEIILQKSNIKVKKQPKQDKLSKYLQSSHKKNKIQLQQNDQIEEITLQKNLPLKNQLNNKKNIEQQFQTIILGGQINNKVQQVPIQRQLTQAEKLQQESKLAFNNQIINQFTTLLNILGDIAVKSIKMKDKLTNIQWRKTVYFLYQRFYFERQKLLQNLQSCSKNICRSFRKIDTRNWNLWKSSQKRLDLIQQIQKQNKIIMESLNKMSLKLLQQCKFERNVQYYVRNRQKLNVKYSDKIRFQLSKCTVTCIIKEFDAIIQQKIKKKQIINHVLDCTYALRILAQLDQITKVEQFVRLQEYKQYKYDLRVVSEMVDHIYDLYFPDLPNQN